MRRQILDGAVLLAIALLVAYGAPPAPRVHAAPAGTAGAAAPGTRAAPGPAMPDRNVIGSLWTAQQPSRLAVVTLPATATVSQQVTAEIFEGVHNALTAKGGTLVWLDYGDGAYQDAFWPARYAATYGVAAQPISLTTALAMATGAMTPTQGTTATTTATAAPPASASATLAATATPLIGSTPGATAPVTGTAPSALTPTAAITPTSTPTAQPTATALVSATAATTPPGVSTPTVAVTATAPITRYVIWDPALPATIDVAATIAGVDHVLAIDPADETAGLNLKGLGYHLFLDLRGRFHNRDEAYTWALANLAAATDHRAIAMQGVGDHGEDGPASGARDYAVAARAFQFSVPPADPLYDRILAAFPQETIVLGFDPTDQKTFVNKASMRGDVEVNTALARNLSCHSAFKPPTLKRQPDPTPAQVHIDPTKVYLAFTISDGDAVGLSARFYNNRADETYTGLWRDVARGRIPLGWSISPVMSQIQRGVMAELYTERTANDYFVSWLPGGYYNYSALPLVVRHDVLAWNGATMDDAGLRVGWTYDDNPQSQLTFTADEAAAYVDSIKSIGWVQGYHDDAAYLNTEHYRDPLFEGHEPRPYLFNAIDALGDEYDYTEFKINQMTDGIAQRPLFLPMNFVIWHVRTLGDLLHIWRDLQQERPGRYELVTPGQLMALQTRYLTQGGVRGYLPLLYPKGHAVGYADGDGWAVDAANGPGLMSTGPAWTSLTPGEKVAAFRLLTGNNTADDALLARLSVVDGASGKVLGQLAVKRRDFTAVNTYQDFLVPFKLTRSGVPVDLRVEVTGRAYLNLSKILVHTAQVWGATDRAVQHDVGRTLQGGAGWSADPAHDTFAGYLSRVPATKAVPGGTHAAVWRLAIDDNARDDEVVATVAVYDRDTKAVLAARDVKRQDFALAGRPQDFTMTFSNTAGHRLDLRTYYWARAAISQQYVLVRD